MDGLSPLLRELLAKLCIAPTDLLLLEQCGSVDAYVRAKIRHHQEKQNYETLEDMYHKVVNEGLGYYVTAYATVDGIPLAKLFFDTLCAMIEEGKDEPQANWVCESNCQLGELKELRHFTCGGLDMCAINRTRPADIDLDVNVLETGARVQVLYNPYSCDDDDIQLDCIGWCTTYRTLLDLVPRMKHADKYGFYSEMSKNPDGEPVVLFTFGECY
jgi:hypothetical protein